MRLVLISDTHGLHRQMPTIPDGDVLIHAGDMTDGGSLEEVKDFLAWYGALPHRAKIVIAGNHDLAFEEWAQGAEALVPLGVTYLEDSGVRIDGLNLWGSPWQPWFFDWAFNLRRGAEIAAKWALIPNDTHVLITHGPPHGVLDQVGRGRKDHVGCEALAARVAALSDLQVHVFGHIHEAHGHEQRHGRLFVNACICDADYRPGNAPVVVDLDREGIPTTVGAER